MEYKYEKIIDWFLLPRALIDEYAGALSAMEISLFVLLCSYADIDYSGTVSIDTIHILIPASQLNTSLSLLASFKLISVESLNEEKLSYTILWKPM